MTVQCKQCGKSLVNTRAGSFTSYLFQQNYCQCNKSKQATTASLVCTNCGKSVAKKRAGSFTSFLFQELRCQCAQPALPNKSSAARTNTQVRQQAMAEKRGYTANFKANADTGGKLPQVDFSPGTVIGGSFKIISEIGEGGMGIVYLAQHLSLHRQYALKILSPSIVSEQSWLRFKAEAKTLSVLHHPGLVQVYDLGIHENSVPYYSMDYLEGETLEDLLVRKGPQPLEYTISIFLAVLDALAYAHRNNVVHRDIKPANIFICQNQEIKILDFGISKLIGDKHSQCNQELTAIGEVFGSPYYMSPEQCRGEQIDFRSDIYSAGCTLFEALTGYVPFESANSLEIAMLHEEGDIPLLSDVCDIAFPPSLDIVIAKCLAKQPQDRYQSCKEMAIDLTRIREGKSLEAYAGRVTTSGSSAYEAEPLGGRFFAYSIVSIFAVCLAAGAIFVIAFQPMVPVKKPTVDIDIPKPSKRPIIGLTELGDDLTKNGTFHSTIDDAVKGFFKKPFKYYSQIVSKSGKEIRVFTFPSDISLGMLYWNSDNVRSRKEARGIVEVPANLPLVFSGNANVQFHPQLLNYFRSDDLRELALSTELTRVDLMLAAVARLTSLEVLKMNRMVLNSNSPNYLNRLTRLNTLVLRECQIEPEIFARILPVGRVKSLFLDGGPMISTQLKVIAKNPHLTALRIDTAVLSPEDIKLIASMHSLETLNLKFGSLTNDDLKELTSLTNLQDLDISLTKVDRNCIDTLFKFHKLRKLAISDLPVADEKRLRSALPRLDVIE